MQKAGKFYKKLGIPEGSSFPTESYVAVGDLFYRTDEDIAYCYTLSGWASILASGDGVSNFLSLTDTPSTYAGVGGYKATVKLDETGLEFTATVSGEVSNFVDLLDVPDSYTTFSGYYASVKGDETGLEFTLPPVWKDVRIVAKDGALYTSIVTAYTDAPSGTTILLMPGTYDDDSLITIPDGITIKGVSRDNCIIDAEIRVEDGGITYLENVSVVRSGSPTYAVRPYSTTGTHYFINVRVDVTSSTNSSSCFYLNSGGSVFLINCEGTISGAGDPQYGVWQASAGTSWVIGGRFHGATTADLYRNDGTLNIANVAYDTKSGTLVYNGTATEVDGYSPSEAGAVSSLIASDSSGDVQLASGEKERIIRLNTSM
jgi:hypothetical protein